MIQTFEQFMASTNTSIPIIGFSINIILAGIFSNLLKWVYVNYGNSLSNRNIFGKNFFLITMTTNLVITIVKSSLALSLGLVGALSIIRFRAAIKEPEELAYLFLAIALGLGFGSGQTVITIISFIIISASIVFYKNYQTIDQDKPNSNMNVIIRFYGEESVKLDDIVVILEKFTSFIKLRRIDESSEKLEVSFFVEFNRFADLNNAKEKLKELNKNIDITFIDNSGLI